MPAAKRCRAAASTGRSSAWRWSRTCRRMLARWVGQARRSRWRPRPPSGLRSRRTRSCSARRFTHLGHAAGGQGQAAARSPIRSRWPAASDTFMSALYSLSDMSCPRSRSASRARGTVITARAASGAFSRRLGEVSYPTGMTGSRTGIGQRCRAWRTLIVQLTEGALLRAPDEAGFHGVGPPPGRFQACPRPPRSIPAPALVGAGTEMGRPPAHHQRRQRGRARCRARRPLPPPPALHNLERPRAGTGGLIVGAHRGRARAGR
jgi:hypothetical protein